MLLVPKPLENLLRFTRPLAEARSRGYQIDLALRSGVGDRSELQRQRALLRQRSHESFCGPEFGRLLTAAQAVRNDLPPPWGPYVDVLAFSRDHQSALNAGFIKERDLVTDRAYRSWERAKDANDASLHLEDLAAVIDNQRQEARLLGGDPNDPMSLYAKLFAVYGVRFPIHRLFEAIAFLKEHVPQLLLPFRNGGSLRSALVDDLSLESRIRIAQKAMAALGVDLPADHIVPLGHPMCFFIGLDEVTITCCRQEERPFGTIFELLHEAGHARFWLASMRELRRHFTSSILLPRSLDESQSMLFERVLGTERSFLEFLYCLIREEGGLAGVEFEEFFQERIGVTITPVRSQADQLTFMLLGAHFVETEFKLIAGQVEVVGTDGRPGLREHYADSLEALLGIRPRDDREGILQTPHLAQGIPGYYGNYLLAMLINTQLYQAWKRSRGADWEDDFCHGDFRHFLAWLEEYVHRDGYVMDIDDVLIRATGEPLNPRHWLEYAVTKVEQASKAVSA